MARYTYMWFLSSYVVPVGSHCNMLNTYIYIEISKGVVLILLGIFSCTGT